MGESNSSENCIDSSNLECGISSIPDEVLGKILGFVECRKDKSSISLVCKDWYNAERFSRSHLYIPNCYAVSPEIVARRFPNIRSVSLKGSSESVSYSMPSNCYADVHPWLLCFAEFYPFLEELRLKRMSICDHSLEFLAMSFLNFRRLCLFLCVGFDVDGLSAIAAHCKNLVELDVDENALTVSSGSWLSFFPESFTSMEILKFSNLPPEVSFASLERLVSRCKSLKVLKVNGHITIEQLHRLLMLAPWLTELGAGDFSQELQASQYAGLQNVFNSYTSLKTLYWLGLTNPLYLPLLYPFCNGLTFLNLCGTAIHNYHLALLLGHCPNIRRFWVLDCIGDEGMEAIGLFCPLLEELRVFGLSHSGVTDLGFVSVSKGCPNLRYVLLFCTRMTNAAVSEVVQNCPHFTHFRLFINFLRNPRQPDHLTNEPMDEAFGSVVKTCKNLRRLQVSGLLTDLAFEYIGKYAKNLETLSVSFAGGSDYGMQCILRGCLKLRKLEIGDCPFGNAGLLSGLDRYESMRSVCMSSCNVTMSGCQDLASKMPRLTVEVIKDDKGNVKNIYMYRTLAGPRKDAPPSVLVL